MIATVRVGERVGAVVERHHRALDARLARVLPAVGVAVVVHLADDRAEVEHRIQIDGKRGLRRVGDGAGLAHIHGGRLVAVLARRRTGTDDHPVGQHAVAGLARVGDAAAVQVVQGSDVAQAELQRSSPRRVRQRDAVQARAAGDVLETHGGRIHQGDVGHRAIDEIAHDHRIAEVVAHDCRFAIDGLGEVQDNAAGEGDRGSFLDGEAIRLAGCRQRGNPRRQRADRPCGHAVGVGRSEHRRNGVGGATIGHQVEHQAGDGAIGAVARSDGNDAFGDAVGNDERRRHRQARQRRVEGRFDQEHRQAVGVGCVAIGIAGIGIDAG